MTQGFKRDLEILWHEGVNNKYLYRGMAAHDVKDPLDPGYDPFSEVQAHFLQLIEVLERVLAAGFEFTVYEDHSGLSFDLKDIVVWSRRDLENGGLDFTSSYESACGYSKNF